MGSSKTAPWVLGTAFAAVLILIGAWLLVISPKMAVCLGQTRTGAIRAGAD